MRVISMLIAEYAGVAHDGKVTMAGVFDNLNVTRNPDAPPDAPTSIPFPGSYLVLITEASLADGLTHTFRLRIIDGEGRSITKEPFTFPVVYSLNAQGRPMRNQMIITLKGVHLPKADDYVFEVTVEGQVEPLAEYTFFVTWQVPPSDG